MGLFGRKKKKKSIYEELTGFSESFEHEPCFNDLMMAEGQAAYTNVDLLRLNDAAYLDGLGFGPISFDDPSFLRLVNSPLPSPLQSLSVTKDALRQNGFVMSCLVTLTDNMEASKRRGIPQLTQICATTLNLFAIASINFLLNEYPSYLDPYVKMAPVFKYHAGKG